MLLKSKHTLAVLALVLGFITFGCTDDEEKVEEPVQPTAAPEPTPEPEPAPVAVTPETVYFAFDDYTLSSEARSKLQGMSEQLKGSQSAMVQVEGHCDERGSIEYNLALGERRANSVKTYLVELGIDASRVSTISYGEEKPAADGHDESAWSKNRRAEFTVSGN